MNSITHTHKIARSHIQKILELFPAPHAIAYTKLKMVDAESSQQVDSVRCGWYTMCNAKFFFNWLELQNELPNLQEFKCPKVSPMEIMHLTIKLVIENSYSIAVAKYSPPKLLPTREMDLEIID